jgi:hypothetical protein
MPWIHRASERHSKSIRSRFRRWSLDHSAALLDLKIATSIVVAVIIAEILFGTVV